MRTSNKNIDKIKSLQKKVIRLLIELPRISHTVEAFWALNILPCRKLGIFNVKIFFSILMRPITPNIQKRFHIIKIKNANLGNKNNFNIPRVKSIKIELLPSHNFPKI